MAMCISLNLRGHGTAHALIALKEGLGRAETEEHVQSHRNMVLVVGNIEADQLMALVVFTFIERKDQTAEFLFGTIHLEILLTTIL